MKTNYELAQDCATDAFNWGSVESASVAGMRAQTYATLALVDALTKADAEPDEGSHVEYVTARDTGRAIQAFIMRSSFTTHDEAAELAALLGDSFSVYQVSVKVVQE